MADERKKTPTAERDFGPTDRYDNKDNNKDEAGDVRNTSNDGKQDEDPDDPASEVNRDE
jgi:hypothetical protein